VKNSKKGYNITGTQAKGVNADALCFEVCRLDHLKLFKDRFRSDPDRDKGRSDGLRMASTAQAAHRADMLACYATTQRSLNMQRFLFAVAIAATVMPVFAAAGVSVSIGQPGFYGRLDIGNVPPPPLLYPQPLVIQPMPVGVAPQPIYLHVPPGHAKNWRKHCHRYNACGQPVYFVQEHWYNDVYVPYYRTRGDDRDKHHGEGHGKDHQGHGRGHEKD